MSLFLKIFLWFWLAMALIVGAVMFVNWSTRTAPLARQFRTFVGEAIKIDSQTAVQIYENEGKEFLKEYIERQTGRRRMNSIGVFDQNQKLVAGNIDFEKVRKLADLALKSDETQFERHPEKTFGVTKVLLKNGDVYLYAVELRRFRPPHFFTQSLLLSAAVVILVAGLVCYGLARYLSSPITKLRNATQRFASGDFETRVSAKVGKGGDELANLARDFDDMAERIEALINSEKRLTQDISHELRSPLARMNVALELARKKANDDTIPMLDRLEGESKVLNALISQLLTLSKLETGSHSFEKMEVNLANLVEKIVADANYEARLVSKSVKIIENQDAKVFGNEQLLHSAIENVLRNAVRYSKEETEVEVSISEVGDSVKVGIRDFGEGVPEEELEKLFRPFYRIEVARDRRSGGTGLGLAIAERAVTNHKGTISAENTGEGLLVEIELPAVKY